VFRRLKKKWYKIINEEEELVKIRVGDIRFTVFKKDALSYNETFPLNLDWTEEQIILREDIRNNNYKPKTKYPRVSVDNICLDGHHRLTSLLAYRGEDHVVVVFKSKLTYNEVLWLLLISLPFMKNLTKDNKPLDGDIY
jgi:hypothetical protein